MIFSDNYEIQIILFLVAIIFVNYAYSISFWTYFWNCISYFQRMLIAVNNITHDINCNHDHVHYMYTDLELY